MLVGFSYSLYTCYASTSLPFKIGPSHLRPYPPNHERLLGVPRELSGGRP